MATARTGVLGETRGRPLGGAYPFEHWSDGQIWTVTKGIDFETAPGRFAHSAYSWGRTRGYKVATRVNGNTVDIQFTRIS